MSEAGPAPGAPPRETTPLEERLVALIRANGPISVADYMADALGHPHDGYYASRPSIGADGDFTTAPEISQIFGELVGAWLVQSWADIGSPASFSLVELGPGRGVLMADALRAARVRPAFMRAAKLFLVEASGRLRHEQQRRLRTFPVEMAWKDRFDDIPDGPFLLIANEFFDCLPVRQFRRAARGWRERLVGLEPGGNGLAFVDAAVPPPSSLDLPPPDDLPEGAVFERCEAGTELAARIADRLKASSGRALIIDYGRIGPAIGDTLQAVRAHAFWPPLAAPGRADITAHVDFAALARAALTAGAGVHGPTAQGTFLERLGLGARLERLCSGRPADRQAELHAGAHRIAAPGEMGEIFKAICFSSPDLPRPAGF